MRVRLMTFRYSATLGGFDDGPLEEFIRDKEASLALRHERRTEVTSPVNLTP